MAYKFGVRDGEAPSDVSQDSVPVTEAPPVVTDAVKADNPPQQAGQGGNILSLVDALLVTMGSPEFAATLDKALQDSKGKVPMLTLVGHAVMAGITIIQSLPGDKHD